MAQEPPRNYAPIDSTNLETYPLPPKFTIHSNGELTDTMTFNNVRAWPPWTVEDIVEYWVEVEFQVGKVGISHDNVEEYLYSYGAATISQEAMTIKIQRDLSRALEVDNIVVKVYSEVKSTKFGEID